jgi:hypothetical protein
VVAGHFVAFAALTGLQNVAEIQAQGIGHAQVPQSAAMRPPWRTRGQSVKRRPSGPDRSHAHVRSPEDSEDQPWMRCWGWHPRLHLLMDNCRTPQNTSGTTGLTTAGGHLEIFP